MKYKEFNSQSLRLVRVQLQRLLDGFAKEHGLEIQLQGMRYEATSFKVPMQVKIEGAVTAEESFAIEWLEEQMKEHGLSKTGRNGEKLIKFDSKKPKYPFIFQKNGKQYKCSLIQAKQIFGAPRPTVVPVKVA